MSKTLSILKWLAVGFLRPRWSILDTGVVLTISAMLAQGRWVAVGIGFAVLLVSNFLARETDDRLKSSQ